MMTYGTEASRHYCCDGTGYTGIPGEICPVHYEQNGTLAFMPGASVTQSDEFALGPCGCVDYHMSDCPIRTGGTAVDEGDWYDDDSRAYDRDDWR